MAVPSLIGYVVLLLGLGPAAWGVEYEAGFDRSIVVGMPVDSAFRVGEQARLPCTLKSAASYDSVTWEVMFVGTSSLIELLYGRKGVKTRMNDARFYSDATKAYDLVIKEMTYDLAGVYICKVRDTATKTATATANIMAIDGPTCSRAAVNSTTTALDCVIRYRAMVKTMPDLRWYDVTHQNLDATYVTESDVNRTEVWGERRYRLGLADGKDDKSATCRAFTSTRSNRTDAFATCRYASSSAQGHAPVILLVGFVILHLLVL